jgi:hypothetical protein
MNTLSTLDLARTTISTFTPPPAKRASLVRPRRVRTALSLVVLALPLSLSLPLFTGCAGDDTVAAESDETGDAEVGVTTQALSVTSVTRVTITVSGPGITTSLVQNLAKVNGQWTGKLGGIPVGVNRTFQADAYDVNNAIVYTGQATGQTVATGAPGLVVLNLQQKTAPTAFANSVPEIGALTASASQVAQGGTIALNVAATDPDNDPLTYTWTATGGTFSNAALANPIWTAPATDGAYTLSVSVSDGKGGQAGLSVTATVVSTGSANLTTTFNTWPVVNVMTAAPGQINPTQTTTLNVVAADADGDSMTYAWTDSCGGSFSSTTVVGPVWTPPAVTPMSGMCSLSVAVSDNHGGSTSGSLVIGINLPTVNQPPILDTDFQSATAVLVTQQVDVSFTAHDPENTVLTYTWTTNGGTLGAPTSTTSSTDVLWTAPLASGTFTITGTAQDLAGAQATKIFSVSVTGSCSDGIQDYGETGLDCGGPCGSCGTYALAGDGDTGSANMCLIKNSSGAASCWGFNLQGALGNGTTTNATSPVTVSGGLQLASVSVGGFSGFATTCGVTTAGAGYCWGDNAGAQLGNGTTTSSSVPVPVSGGLTFSQITVARYGACGLTTSGAAYCWGNNSTAGTSTVPVAVGGGLTFTHLVGQGYATCGLTAAGAAYCWGDGSQGQLGNGILGASTVPVAVSGGLTFASLSAGFNHACGVTTAGAAYCWGANTYGQLGNGTTTSSSVPVAVGGGLTLGSIAGGYSHTCAITTSGAAYCWGGDVAVGILGDGTTAFARTSPAAVSGGNVFSKLTGGNGFTCGLTGPSGIKCWGRNSSGQLGNGTTTNSSVPVSPINLP